MHAPTLWIFVVNGCATCHAVLGIAETVRRARPAQPLEIIDVGESSNEPLPPGVVGTPTYLLGTEVLSLGNPDPDELLSQLDTAAGTGDDD